LLGGHARVDKGRARGISLSFKKSSDNSSSIVALSAGFILSILEMKSFAIEETLVLGKEY
jgi:hypothetical protein